MRKDLKSDRDNNTCQAKELLDDMIICDTTMLFSGCTPECSERLRGNLTICIFIALPG